MSQADTDVANIALDLLKEGIITSFDDDRPAGRWMKRNYSVVRDMTLSANPWRFAVQRFKLPANSEAPTFGYKFSYAKPDGCLRVMPLRYLGQTNGALIRYSVEGNIILCDANAPLLARCILRVVDASMFSPLFIDAFTTSMAMRLANWLTGKEGIIAGLKASYKEAMTLAMFTDSAEGYAEDQVADQYDNVRFTNNSPIRYPGSY